MVSVINQTFMKLSRRAERVDQSKLVSTFVDIGPLFTLLSSMDHQVVYGRRGTGKTHALLYLAEKIRNDGDIPVFVDLRILGSSTGTYSDETIPITQRGTTLLVETVAAIYDKLFEYILDYEKELDAYLPGQLLDDLDQLSRAMSEVKVIAGQQEHSEDKVSFENYTVRFGPVAKIFNNFCKTIKPRRIWILLDEWSSIPPILQPYLADFLQRSIFPLTGITVKIASIEHRSQFQIPKPQGGYVGIELGADAAADVNLDDFMVFDSDAQRSRQFFKELLFKHFSAIDGILTPDIKSPEVLIKRAFTQENVFLELIRASEGNPRDAINIIIQAAQQALDNLISMGHIRTSAKNWYQRDKGSSVESNIDAFNLLQWIVDEVIGRRQARAFFLERTYKQSRHKLIDFLFDARILHILKRNISTKDQPGVRYDAYKIDYGCYVDLITTKKHPKFMLASGEVWQQGLFDWEDFLPEDKDEEVPYDDYRTIRRNILDLDEFEKRLRSWKLVK